MTPLLGGDSEAMHFMVDKLRSAQPPPPPTYVPGTAGGAPDRGLGAIEDDVPPPGPRAPQPPPHRPAPQDDEDFGERGFLR